MRYFLSVCFFCSVKLFSAVAGPIGAKFGIRHEPDASQVLRDFGGAIPREGEIIAQNVLIRGHVWPIKYDRWRFSVTDRREIWHEG